MCPFSNSTLNIAFDNASVIVPSCCTDNCFVIFRIVLLLLSLFHQMMLIFPLYHSLWQPYAQNVQKAYHLLQLLSTRRSPDSLLSFPCLSLAQLLSPILSVTVFRFLFFRS